MTTPNVLVVCTANVARSPLFAALLQAEADARLGADVVRIGSAGVQAKAGQPAASGSRLVASRRATSLDSHLAQHVATVSLQSVGLLLTMSDEHNEQLLAGRAALRSRTFLLREFVAILHSEDVLTRISELPSDVDERLSAVAAVADEHRPKRLIKRNWNVPDPIRAGIEVYEELGAEFARSASVVGDALFGAEPARQDHDDRRPNIEWFP